LGFNNQRQNIGEKYVLQTIINNIGGNVIRKAFTLWLITIINLQAAEVTNSKHDTVAAISYNIQLSGLDEEGHKWDEGRKKAVISLLERHEILAIQEISYEQLNDLKVELPDYHFVSMNSITGESLTHPAVNTIEGMAIGYNQHLFEQVSLQTFWLSNTPEIPSKSWGNWETSFAKLLQRVVLNHLPTSKEIVIYNSHFCHEEDPHNVINPRLEAAKLEISFLQKDIAEKRILISAGDRNTHLPRDRQVIELYDRVDGLKDVDNYRVGLKTTFIGYEKHPRMNPIINGKFEKSMNLDKVYIAGDVELLHAVSLSGAYDETYQLKEDQLSIEDITKGRPFASDHTAISVSLGIKS